MSIDFSNLASTAPEEIPGGMMAHFQVPLKLPNVKEFTRFWVKGSAGAEQIVLHLNAKVALEQWGNGTDQSVPPALYSGNPAVAEISGAGITGIRQSFFVQGKMAGTATLNGRRRWTDTTTGTTIEVDDVYPLKVFVGDFTNHGGMTVDLLAKGLGRSNDAFKILCLLRMLNNNTEGNSAADLFDQESTVNKNKFGELACGSVAENIGKVLLGKPSTTLFSYHIPLKPGSVKSRNDVKYESAKMASARAAIKKLLSADTPVVVGCAWDPTKTTISKAGALQRETTGGHSVIIVGCNDDGSKLLYADPFPGGSKLVYKGGVAGSPSRPTDPCIFLGEFETDTASTRGPVLRQTGASEGSFKSPDDFLEVISGPL